MKRLVSRIALAALALACIVVADERLLFPEDFAGPPAYMRLETAGPLGITDLEWVAIPVYREISGIPLDFNLLDFLDNATPARAAYARSVPLLVEGFVIREGTPPPPPHTQHYEDRASVDMPILFVSWDELQGEVADGDLYIDELLSMESLQVGIADFYVEHIRTAWTHSIVTSGEIVDGDLEGADFHVSWAHGAATQVPGVVTHITIK
jgi:hypothetical protein